MNITRKFLPYIIMLLCINAFAQNNNYKLSKPLKGEGLNAFLIRNKLNTPKTKSEFIELNKDKLGKTNSLQIGIYYKIPNTEVWINEPLFGKKRARFKLDSKELNGAVFYLISGHGGPDPGALGKYGRHTLAEDEYAYDITLRLAKRLMENGAKVNMIIQDAQDGIRDKSYLEMSNRETCMGAKIPLDQVKRLKQRSDLVNKLYIKNKPAYQRCIIIHVDSRNTGKSIDVFFYHAINSKSGKIAAEKLRSVFDAKYNKHQPSRGYSGIVSERNLYVLRNTLPPAVFVELGNIRNKHDQQRFIKDDNRQALANWFYEGLKNDFKSNK